MIPVAHIVVDPLVWQIPLVVLAVVACLALVYYVYIGLTLKMARNRHRDPLGWILLSLLVSPFLTWIVLLIAGDAEK